MEIDYGYKILSKLIDWYESSPTYARDQKQTRRRNMKLYDNGQTDFPDYNIENPIIKNDINQAVLDLTNKELIGFQWMRGQKNHIISKLWLNVDLVGKVYDQLGRRPKRDIVDDTLLQLNDFLTRIKAHYTTKFPVQWIYKWLEDSIEEISRKRSIGVILPEQQSERDDLFKAFSYLANNTELETLVRVFSMDCFGDSKHFELSVKSRLVRIIKKYLAQDNCTDEEALRLVGIVSYPEQFAFSGDLTIVLPKGSVNFALLPFGGTLTIDDVKSGQIIIAQNVKRVLTIENRANYVDYVHKSQESNELVLYHGGQFSPAKRIFFQKVVSSLPSGCNFYHWGDIDYGGFLMLARLRREIFSAIKPWRMNQNELVKYMKFTVGFSETYRKRLTSLLEISELSDCFSCIEYMLKINVRLEQEIMLV